MASYEFSGRFGVFVPQVFIYNVTSDASNVYSIERADSSFVGKFGGSRDIDVIAQQPYRSAHSAAFDLYFFKSS